MKIKIIFFEKKKRKLKKTPMDVIVKGTSHQKKLLKIVKIFNKIF